MAIHVDFKGTSSDSLEVRDKPGQERSRDKGNDEPSDHHDCSHGGRKKYNPVPSLYFLNLEVINMYNNLENNKHTDEQIYK